VQFTIVKNLKKDSTMNSILKGLIFFILLYIIADIFVKYVGIGLTLDTLNISLFGNEEEYIEPMSQALFLEFWHTEIFFIMMILLTLSTVYIRLASNIRHYKYILNLVMSSAIISLISLPIAYYMSNDFILIYILGYFIWHGGAIYMSLRSLWELYA